jgi:hypothetical protein
MTVGWNPLQMVIGGVIGYIWVLPSCGGEGKNWRKKIFEKFNDKNVM